MQTADNDLSDDVDMLCLALQDVDVLPGCAKTADNNLSDDVGILCLALQDADVLPGCARSLHHAWWVQQVDLCVQKLTDWQ